MYFQKIGIFFYLDYAVTQKNGKRIKFHVAKFVENSSGNAMIKSNWKIKILYDYEFAYLYNIWIIENCFFPLFYYTVGCG